MITMADGQTIDQEQAIREVSGVVTALDLAIKAIILTHPDRAALRHLWRTLVPEQIDTWMQDPRYSITVQRNAIHRTLADLSGFIEMQIPPIDEQEPAP